MQSRRYRVTWGIGAGAGAALAMMLVMAGLRLAFGFPTIPELMLNTALKLMGGQAFSNALDTLYFAGRPLLFAVILEGTLLLGAVLGLLYAALARPNPATGERQPLFNSPLGGLIYGLLIGVLLNTVFLPLVGQPVFADRIFGIVPTQSAIPPWAGLFLLSLVFGLTLHALLPKGVAPVQLSAGSAPVSVAVGQEMERRHFLRIAGGTLLAALGGGAVVGIGTFINQGWSFTSPVDRPTFETAGTDVAQADTPTPRSVSQANPTATGEPTALPTPEPPRPTDTSQPVPTDTAQPILVEVVDTATAVPVEAPPTLTPEPPTPVPSPPTDVPPTSAPAIAQATDTVVPIVQSVADIKVLELTPTTSFYHISKNFFDPTPQAEGWKLEIKGLVDKPYSLTYEELIALPSVEVVVGMMCISNPIGGGLIGSTTWKGVRLADLLKQARPKKGVVDVAMSAVDGYTDSIPYKKALDPNVVLAWEMGGAPLTSQHGFPARLLVPGIYGMKHVKWITSLELVNHDFKGYWQEPSQGWSDPAPVNTMSRIDFPVESTLTTKKQILSGIAFAGDRSISRVEISADGGKTWAEAYVKPPMSGASWVVWGYEWTPAKKGKYTIQVRATDGAGKLQSARRTDPYPNGATGYHTVSYNVK